MSCDESIGAPLRSRSSTAASGNAMAGSTGRCTAAGASPGACRALWISGSSSAIATAPAMPVPPEDSTSRNVVMPMTTPSSVSNGPPELPEVSVTSDMIARDSILLTMPLVITLRWLRGLPMVKTRCPTTIGGPAESPPASTSGRRPATTLGCTWRIAMSLAAERATTRAGTFSVPSNCTAM